MGKKVFITITGTNHYLGDEFLEKGTIMESPGSGVHECCRGIDTPFSDRLKPEKITLCADVKIVWLVE